VVSSEILFFLFDLFVLSVYSVRMKQKPKQKKPQKGIGEVQAGAPSASRESQPPAAEVKSEPQPVPTEVQGYAPPEVVAEAARGEPNVRLVADYREAITVLRDEKGFTFREIAEWLESNFGIEADHNAVWRAYTKGASEQDAALAAMDDDRDEQDLALG
jgi:hypothetical protein